MNAKNRSRFREISVSWSFFGKYKEVIVFEEFLLLGQKLKSAGLDFRLHGLHPGTNVVEHPFRADAFVANEINHDDASSGTESAVDG